MDFSRLHFVFLELLIKFPLVHNSDLSLFVFFLILPKGPLASLFRSHPKCDNWLESPFFRNEQKRVLLICFRWISRIFHFQ